MTDLEFDYLCACHESVQRQLDLVPLLAESLGVAPEQVFHLWAVTRCKQSGRIGSSGWRYFFHGLECDLMRPDDGRFLRVAFGPGGRYDTFDDWGVVQFIMAAKAPWKTFPGLRSHLFDNRPPRGAGETARPEHLSGSHTRMRELSGFLSDYTENVPLQNPDPEAPENLDTSLPGFWDKLVSRRIRLSARGNRLVTESGTRIQSLSNG